MLRDALPEIITEKVPGPKAEALLKKRNAALPKALCTATYPICISRGEGAVLEDVDGNKFLDFIGGVGVLNIGYSRPEIIEAVKEQAEKYNHSVRREFAFLVAHSMLHLLGYDHMTPEEAKDMESRQSAALEHLGITRD